MQEFTIQEFKNASHYDIEMCVPFMVNGVYVVELNIDEYAKLDYLNPFNKFDYLHGVTMTKKQIIRSINDDVARVGCTMIYA